MSWCEEHGVGYVFGLAKNKRLVKIIGRQLHEAQVQFEATKRPVRVFTEFSYRTHQELETRAARGGQGRAFG